ncbi:hypothetical protein HDU86_006831 [Geranomyces michiganensis]|nr:hypothetical protein HDU86_006831 [Geranomyces michiganensis]
MSRPAQTSSDDLDRELFALIRRFPSLPPVRRQAALLALFHQCDPIDMAFIAKVYPRLHRDFVRLLPTTAVHTILQLCAPRDFCTIARVSPVWLERMNDLALWESLYGRVGLGALVARCYRPAEGMRGNAQRLDAFERWVRGELTCRRFRAHGSGIVALSVDGGTVVTAGVDRTIRVHDGRTGECLRTFSGHEFTCVQVLGKMLASGSADGTLRLWILATGKQEQELPGHTSGITIVKLRGQTVVTGSTDQTLKIWLLPKPLIPQPPQHDGTFNKSDRRRTEHFLQTQRAPDVDPPEKAMCVRTLAGHEAAIKCIDFAAGILVSGDIAGALRVWHIASGNCLGVFTITPAAGPPTFHAFRKQENTASKTPTTSRRHDALSSVNFSGASLLFTTLSGRLFLYDVAKPAEAFRYEEAREWAATTGTFTINQALNWTSSSEGVVVDTLNAPASPNAQRPSANIPVPRARAPAGGGTWALCSQLDEWRIIAGGSDGSCVVWNHFTGKRVYALRGMKLMKGDTGADIVTLRRSPGTDDHDSDGEDEGSIKAITGVAFDTQRIYAACMSGYIRVWECIDSRKYS